MAILQSLLVGKFGVHNDVFDTCRVCSLIRETIFLQEDMTYWLSLIFTVLCTATMVLFDKTSVSHSSTVLHCVNKIVKSLAC